jgi:hypothetical protein
MVDANVTLMRHTGPVRHSLVAGIVLQDRYGWQSAVRIVSSYAWSLSGCVLEVTAFCKNTGCHPHGVIAGASRPKPLLRYWRVAVLR